MKRKLLAILTSVLLLCAMLPLGAIPVVAATSGITGDCTWTLDGSHLTISGYGAMADYDEVDPWPWGVSITSLTIEDGVTAIGDNAFNNCRSLTSVTIGNSVTIIGESAFSNCRLIQKINIPDSVRYIGESAFFRCECMWFRLPDNITYIGAGAFSMTANDDVYGSGYDFYAGKSYAGGKYLLDAGNRSSRLTIKEGTELIAAGAFDSCTYSLTSVTIPDSVTTICGVVSNCEKLTSIEVDDNNEYYCDVDGVLYNKDMTRLLKYPAQRSGTAYAIPDGVTTIDEGAFQNCAYLTSVTIPDSVTTIGSDAFAGCDNLMTIEVGDNNPVYCDVDGVWYSKDMTRLLKYPAQRSDTTYTIPDSVTAIEARAFENCYDSPTSLTIPDSVTTIGDYAFDDCRSLTSVKISNSITTIGDYVFYNCCGLTSVTIPDSVTAIGRYAFNHCCGLTSVTIPDSVTVIGRYAFNYCFGLTSVTIPDSVTTIGNSAFDYCTSLTDVYYAGNAQDRAVMSIDSYNTYLTNATWHYNYTPVIFGDADGDGSVNARDAALLQQYVAGWDVTLETSADADGDGSVNARDVALLQQYVAGWDVTLGPV